MRIIDVLVLGKQAFTTASNNGATLKSILENIDIPKCIWDVRNDADALWALYQVGLAGVTDIQLLENASRAGDKIYVYGLDKSIQSSLKLGFMEMHRWIRTKKNIKSSMPADVFANRPLNAETTNTASTTLFIYRSCMLFTWRALQMIDSTRQGRRARAALLRLILQNTGLNRPRRS